MNLDAGFRQKNKAGWGQENASGEWRARTSLAYYAVMGPSLFERPQTGKG